MGSEGWAREERMACAVVHASASTESVSVQRSSRPRRAMAGSDTKLYLRKRNSLVALQGTLGTGALAKKTEGMGQAHETKIVRSFDAES